MRRGTYINEHVAHQIEQPPIIAELGCDGNELTQADTVTGIRWADLVDTFEHWSTRMEFLATWRKAMSRRKKLNGDEP